MAFVATTQSEKARAFFCDILGLTFEEDSPFALVVKAANATLRIQKVQSFEPLPFTSLGWTVEDIKATTQDLIEKGVTFERLSGWIRTILASGLLPAAHWFAGSKIPMEISYP